jgi:hypothetical protein
VRGFWKIFGMDHESKTLCHEKYSQKPKGQNMHELLLYPRQEMHAVVRFDLIFKNLI